MRFNPIYCLFIFVDHKTNGYLLFPGTGITDFSALRDRISHFHLSKIDPLLLRIRTRKLFSTTRDQYNIDSTNIQNISLCRTIVRQRDYRENLLPVEKSLGLVGNFTYKTAHTLVKDGRILINGIPALVGDWVSSSDTLYLDRQPLPPRQVGLSNLTNSKP